MQSTRSYTVTLPLVEGPDLIDALTAFCDSDRLSPKEGKALMTLVNAVESEYNRVAENA